MHGQAVAMRCIDKTVHRTQIVGGAPLASGNLLAKDVRSKHINPPLVWVCYYTTSVYCIYGRTHRYV